MRGLFADTFYFIALLNGHDEAHQAAEQFTADKSVMLVTTAWVLTELADGLALTDRRSVFPDLLVELENDPRVELIPPAEDLWRMGIDLFGRRGDKGWSLTDCISFVVVGGAWPRGSADRGPPFRTSWFRSAIEVGVGQSVPGVTLPIDVGHAVKRAADQAAKRKPCLTSSAFR